MWAIVAEGGVGVLFQWVPMDPDGRAPPPRVEPMWVTPTAGADLVMRIFLGEEYVVGRAARTAERFVNGVSPPTGGLREYSDGGAEEIYLSPGCGLPQDQLAMRAGTNADGESGARFREVHRGKCVLYAGYA